jgi:hypothetical protein
MFLLLAVGVMLVWFASVAGLSRLFTLVIEMLED